MTTIYFIRHAQADATVRDQRTRPLTPKGMSDSALLSRFLRDKQIDFIFSSPYKRTVDTVSCLAEGRGLRIKTIEDFRGLRVDSSWIKDYRTFFKEYWSDFSYRYSDGECLSELQQRNMDSLKVILSQFKDKSIIISTHSVSLATIVNFYDSAFGFEEFLAMSNIEPWILKMDFDHNDCIGITKIGKPWL